MSFKDYGRIISSSLPSCAELPIPSCTEKASAPQLRPSTVLMSLLGDPVPNAAAALLPSLGAETSHPHQIISPTLLKLSAAYHTRSLPPSTSPQPTRSPQLLPITPSSPRSGVPLPSPTYTSSPPNNLNPKHGITECRL